MSSTTNDEFGQALVEEIALANRFMGDQCFNTCSRCLWNEIPDARCRLV